MWVWRSTTFISHQHLCKPCPSAPLFLTSPGPLQQRPLPAMLWTLLCMCFHRCLLNTRLSQPRPTSLNHLLNRTIQPAPLSEESLHTLQLWPSPISNQEDTLVPYSTSPKLSCSGPNPMSPGPIGHPAFLGHTAMFASFHKQSHSPTTTLLGSSPWFKISFS
jgi:hypothetical protein